MVVYDGRFWSDSYMDNVLHVPSMGRWILFSLGAAADKRYPVLLTKDRCPVTDIVDELKLTGRRSDNGVYFVHMKMQIRQLVCCWSGTNGTSNFGNADQGKRGTCSRHEMDIELFK